MSILILKQQKRGLGFSEEVIILLLPAAGIHALEGKPHTSNSHKSKMVEAIRTAAKSADSPPEVMGELFLA